MISVIIPVYNLESYIGRCLDSVCTQTYHNLEVIVVDDGSTDRTARIVQDYAEQDDRIRLISKQNGGVSSARNRGIEAAQGEYITFMDGDDICAKNMLETLLAQMKEDVLLVKCSYVETSHYDEKFESTAIVWREFEWKEYCEQILTGNAEISVCGGAVRRQCLGKLRFDAEIRHNEDKLFLFEYILKNKGKIVCTNAKLYGYVQHSASATHGGYRLALLDVIRANEKILEHAQKNCLELVPQAELNLQIARLLVLKSIISSGCYQKEIETFRKIRREILSYQGDNVPLKRRLEISSLKIGDWLYILNVRLWRQFCG